MSDGTGISWTDATWNPIRVCTRVSEGCRNCYAEKVAHRFSGPGRSYEGLTNAQGRWNGTIRVVDEHLPDPLRWRRPRKVFVNSMSDLFHENVADETITDVFAVMALATQHTFQVLTKRPERMRAYCRTLGRHHEDDRVSLAAKALRPDGPGFMWTLRGGAFLDNVWLGVSVEDQATADARIPLLLQTPAAVRFISAEPLLGPVDVSPYLMDELFRIGRAPRVEIDWLIVGGESGPGARPCDVAWIRSIVQQCQRAGVPAFVKQLGARPRAESVDDVADLAWRDPDGIDAALTPLPVVARLGDSKGADPAEWPEDLRVQEFPAVRS